MTLEILTGVLAVATLVYAGFAGWMAWEIRETRRLSIRPKLALQVMPYSPKGGHLGLANLGPGAALDVDVTISFEPLSESRPWRTDVLAAGEYVEFMFPRSDANASLPDFGGLERHQVRARVHGSAKDVGGGRHLVADEIDAGAWASIIQQSGQIYVKHPMKRIGDELEKISKALGKSR